MSCRIAFPLLAALLAGCSAHINMPLTVAARRGDVAAIRALVRSGADPNRPDGRNGWNPLMHAIHKNQQISVRALLEEGADVNGATANGLTPLIMAAGYGQAAIVRDLLDHGADPHRKTRAGVTALDVAITGVTDIDAFTVGRCQTATVRTLLEYAPSLRPREAIYSRAIRAVTSCPEIDRLLANPAIARAPSSAGSR